MEFIFQEYRILFKFVSVETKLFLIMITVFICALDKESI